MCWVMLVPIVWLNWLDGDQVTLKWEWGCRWVLRKSSKTILVCDKDFLNVQVIIQCRGCYEIDKHTNIYSFTPHTLRIAHKSHSQTETSKTRNNSHLSTRNINDSINSSYHDDIRPIPTSNDTNKSLGDRIYAIGDYIFYFIILFSLYYHWCCRLGLYNSTNHHRHSPRTLWPLYDHVTLFRCIHMTLLDPSISYVRLY